MPTTRSFRGLMLIRTSGRQTLQSSHCGTGKPLTILKPRSFTDDELMAVAQPEGVGRVVLIQHHPYHGLR